MKRAHETFNHILYCFYFTNTEAIPNTLFFNRISYLNSKTCCVKCHSHFCQPVNFEVNQLFVEEKNIRRSIFFPCRCFFKNSTVLHVICAQWQKQAEILCCSITIYFNSDLKCNVPNDENVYWKLDSKLSMSISREYMSSSIWIKIFLCHDLCAPICQLADKIWGMITCFKYSRKKLS